MRVALIIWMLWKEKSDQWIDSSNLSMIPNIFSVWNNLGPQSWWTLLCFAIARGQFKTMPRFIAKLGSFMVQTNLQLRDLLLKWGEWVWAAISPEQGQWQGILNSLLLIFFFLYNKAHDSFWDCFVSLVRAGLTVKIPLNYSLKFGGNDCLWSRHWEGSCNSKKK